MSKNTLYVAVTNHGFGHAVRVATVINHLQEICPEISIIMTTTAPRWLLESYITGDFMYRPRAFDIGVIQADSLNMDLDLTLQRLEKIFADSESLIAEEGRFINENQVGLILADIPPLATKIAKKAGVPCWMISNFGWDLIYRAFGDKFTNIADQIAECFSQCDRLYRLPLHEPMSAFPNIIDVGLTGGKTRYDSKILRSHFHIHDDINKTVL
ncbi:MAG: glycosyl transferase, partial [Microcoleaceae cyanobacterium]